MTKKNTAIAVVDKDRRIVLINDIRFKGKRKIDWDSVEEYLKEYVGSCYEIAESAEKIYIEAIYQKSIRDRKVDYH